jgi:hypothetical protein
MSDQNDFRRRRRSKVIGFIVAEASVIGVLLLAGTFAVSSRLTDSVLVLSVNILTIAAAVAVAIIPIAFSPSRPSFLDGVDPRPSGRRSN